MCLIGNAAMSLAARDPENTVFDARRLIDRKFADPMVLADMKLWPFKVASGQRRAEKKVADTTSGMSLQWTLNETIAAAHMVWTRQVVET